MAGKAKPATGTSTRRQALVVGGMHRSGTSAMARLLSLSGATLPERIMDPGPDNPLGYWEPWEMVALNDQILSAIDSRWDNVFATKDNERAWSARLPFLAEARQFLDHNFGDQDLLVIKDPRSSILSGFWRHVLNEAAVDPVYVIMVRHPLEVADSLLARNGFPREKSLMLWTSYMLAIERDTRDARRVFVTYSDMLNDWRGVLDRIETVLQRPLPRRTPSAGIEIERFLSKSHRHHEADVAAFAQSGHWSGAQTVYDWMLEAARGSTPPVRTLQDIELELDGFERKFGPILAEMREEFLKGRSTEVEVTAAHSELINRWHAEADHQTQQADYWKREAEVGSAKAEILQERVTLIEHQVTEAGDAIAAQAELIKRWHAEADTQTQQAAYWRREAEAERAKVEILQERLVLMEHQTMAMRGLSETNAELQAQMAHGVQQIQGLQTEVQAIMASTSWRLTRPLRAVVRRLRR